MTVPLAAILMTTWPTYGWVSFALVAVGTRTSSSFSLRAKFQVTMKNTRMTNRMSTIGAIKNPKTLGSACLRKFIEGVQISLLSRTRDPPARRTWFVEVMMLTMWEVADSRSEIMEATLPRKMA